MNNLACEYKIYICCQMTEYNFYFSLQNCYTMAPSRRIDHSKNKSDRDEIFGSLPLQARVPDTYIPLKTAERDYGLLVEVYCYWFVCLSVHSSLNCLSVSVSFFLSVCPSVCPSVHLSVRLSVCLSVSVRLSVSYLFGAFCVTL